MNLPYWVYVIAPEGGFPCKIGVARNIERRLDALQSGHWEELFVFGNFYMPNRSAAYRLERYYKKLAKQHRIRGEWFNVFADDMIKMVKEIEKDIEKMLYAKEGSLNYKDFQERYYIEV